MKQPHTPTPWYDYDNGLIYGPPLPDFDEAIFVADVITDARRQIFGECTPTERANAAFIVRACNAHHELVAILKLALEALNTARRFRVNGTDSYAIASRIDAVLKRVEAPP